MRFGSAITTALLGAAALTNSVFANPIENGQLTPRDKTIDEKIGGSPEAWDGYAALCGGQNAKRELHDFYKRKPTDPISPANPLKVGEQGSMSGIPIGFWTWDLVTCIGVVVVGHKKGDKKTLVRAMRHFTADEFSFQTQFDGFKKLVDDLNMEKDGSDCYMSVPDPENQTPATWNDEKKKLAKDIEDKLQDALNDLVDGDCEKTRRFMAPVENNHDDINGVMSVDGNNEVKIAGNKVS